MSNVIQVCQPEDVAAAERSRTYRQAIGRTLAKQYPDVHWLVEVLIDEGIAYVKAPKITAAHGMVLHLTPNIPDIEQKAKKFGGELLERFRVSRDTGDMSHLRRRIDGQALGAAQGEQ